MNAAVLKFVSTHMGVSVERARYLIAMSDKCVDGVQIGGRGKCRVAVLVKKDLSPLDIDVDSIANSLNVVADEFLTTVIDDLVWVIFGANFIEGVAGLGPAPQYAVASFYRRWYEDVVVKNKRILLRNGQYTRWCAPTLKKVI